MHSLMPYKLTASNDFTAIITYVNLYSFLTFQFSYVLYLILFLYNTQLRFIYIHIYMYIIISIF